MARKSTFVVTGKVRLSYANLLEPRAQEDGGKPKYSTAIIIPKSDAATIARINKAIEAAKQEGATSKWGGKVPRNLKTPLRDGDLEREDDPNYANSYFMNMGSYRKPQVIDLNKNPLFEEEDVYSGMYVRVSINFYTYDMQGNKGVAAGLGNVQKLSDGEPLASVSSAEDDFSDNDDFDDDDLM